jgi:hypothetical protein
LPGFAPQRPLFADGLNRTGNLSDAIANAPAVRFEFLLARTPRSDSAAEAGEILAAAREARQKVIQLGKLDLQLTFAAARVPRENIEDQLGSVNHMAVRALFEVAQLSGRQVSVKNNERRLVQARFDFDFLDLAPSNEGGRINLVAHLKNGSRHLRARAARKLRQFAERSALRFSRVNPGDVRRALQAHTYQQCALVAICRSCALHSVAKAGIRPVRGESGK